MVIERNDNQFGHLPFPRVPDTQLLRRTQSYSPPRPPEPEDRSAHAQQVESSFSLTTEQTSAVRQKVGIDSTKLFVLEFSGTNIDYRSAIERYQAWIVDEYSSKKDDDNNVRFLVQFPTETSRQLFEGDLRLYQAGQQVSGNGTLPPAMRKNFFDGLHPDGVRVPSREERMGARLKEQGVPNDDLFYIDVDLWHPQSIEDAQTALSLIRELCGRHENTALVEEVRTASLILAKICTNESLLNELLDIDLVAYVDLPPVLSKTYSDVFEMNELPDIPPPSEDDPIACVIDSGVVSGHPFLQEWVIEAHDFGSGENTPVDLHGHGTAVAGLVAYGSIAQCLQSNSWQPVVKICNAKVLCNEDGHPCFPRNRRGESLTEAAIRYFAYERGCKVFNLSLGDADQVYSGGRQFGWAEKLDELARELDIVIVLSSGNRATPDIPDAAHTKEQFQLTVLENMVADSAQRLCNPATAALALTVGSIASSDAMSPPLGGNGVSLRNSFAASPVSCPTPFSRIGPGYASNSSNPPIKPDLVAPGGNFAVQTLAGGNPRWNSIHHNLGELSLCLEQNGRYVGSHVGTSFSAPQITNAAAIAAKSLESALGREPSANLIRALIGSAAHSPSMPDGWFDTVKDNHLDLIGYGVCSPQDMTWSKQNIVRLVSMETIQEDRLHVYELALPSEFISTRGKRGITVSLAYDPPVRASRREYLARTMQVQVLKGLRTDEVENYVAKQSDHDELSLPARVKIDLQPSRTRLQWSTLQVSRKVWKVNPRLPLLDGEAETRLHFVVKCQKRFNDEDPYQKYGLVITFWHESEDIQLYQALRNRIAVAPTRIRIRS